MGSQYSKDIEHMRMVGAAKHSKTSSRPKPSVASSKQTLESPIKTKDRSSNTLKTMRNLINEEYIETEQTDHHELRTNFFDSDAKSSEHHEEAEIAPCRDAGSPSRNLPISTEVTPVPSKIKRFRVNVPQSMLPGDIMTIKLNGIFTKILISTPTTTSNKEIQVNKSQTNCIEDNPADNSYNSSPTPSQATTADTSSSSWSSSSMVTPKAQYQEPLNNTDRSTKKTITVSSEFAVPDGKLIFAAKPVVVIHAMFPQTDKTLKDQMVDETVKELVQETVNCNCNSILGMTISIKEQKKGSGYLVRCCGTPCLLLPTELLLAPPSMVGAGNNGSAANTTTSNPTTGGTPGLVLRQRTASIDDAPPLKRRH